MQHIPAGYPIEMLSGPLIVGYLLHWGLFGTLSVQLYLYYLAFPRDRKFTKCLVYGIYIVEFVQTMLFTHDAFATFGYGFGDFDALTGMSFNWITVPIMSGAAACVGQVFYAYRIFILSKSRIIPTFIICVSMASFIAAIITGVFCFPVDNIIELENRKMSIAVGIMCGASALCDIVIASCMTYYVSSFSHTVILVKVDTIFQLMRSTTGFLHTRMLVTKLIRLTVETGFVTAAVALTTFILFFVFPHQAFYGTPAFVLSKLYANTALMVLNSRIRIIGGRDIYTSSTNMLSITAAMVKDDTSQSTKEAWSVDGIQGRVSVVAITQENFNDDHEMGRRKENLQGDSMLSLSV
ncbi:hypothetical protein F5146DRAFT_1230723 [Armillaria mellea]|nr:hypothetical protein F5146DRAFT_1230723 [Armillaria mellea]